MRKGGQYYRIYANENTQEFDDEYWEILCGKRHMSKRSWSVLIEEFRKTDKWAGYKPRYRKDLEKIFEYLDQKIGSRDVKQLMAADVYNAMDKNAHRARFANYIPVAVTLLAKLARRKGWLSENPAADIELLKVPDDRKNRTFLGLTRLWKLGGKRLMTCLGSILSSVLEVFSVLVI